MAKQSQRPAVTISGIEFSEADIQALKGGASISGSAQEGKLHTGAAETFRPTNTIPLRNDKTDIRPRTNGRDPNVEGGLVTAPDLSRFTEQHQRQLDEERARAIADAEEKKVLAEKASPSALLAAVNALDRKVRRQEKTIKELQAAVAALTEAQL